MHYIPFNCFMHDFYTLSLCSLRVEPPYGWFSVHRHSHHRSRRCEIKLSYWAGTTLTKLLFVRYAQLCSTCMTICSSHRVHVHALTDTHTHTHTHTHCKIYHSLVMMAHTHSLSLSLSLSLSHRYNCSPDMLKERPSW